MHKFQSKRKLQPSAYQYACHASKIFCSAKGTQRFEWLPVFLSTGICFEKPGGWSKRTQERLSETKLTKLHNATTATLSDWQTHALFTGLYEGRTKCFMHAECGQVFSNT